MLTKENTVYYINTANKHEDIGNRPAHTVRERVKDLHKKIKDGQLWGEYVWQGQRILTF